MLAVAERLKPMARANTMAVAHSGLTVFEIGKVPWALQFAGLSLVSKVASAFAQEWVAFATPEALSLAFRDARADATALHTIVPRIASAHWGVILGAPVTALI